MTILGITGHQHRPGVDWQWVEHELRGQFVRALNVSAFWSCLATGADSIGAELALEFDIPTVAVIPHANYAAGYDGNDLDRYERLAGAAARIMALDFDAPSGQAYLAAGQIVVDNSSHMLAVWDGNASAGVGGTADIVAYSLRNGRAVTWLDVGRKTVSLLA